MFAINLFHEQLKLEAAERRDPLRWTLVLGAFVLTLTLFWVTNLYWNFQKIRTEQGRIQKIYDQLKSEITALSTSDISNVINLKKEIQRLDERIQNHPRLATVLDFLVTTLPQNIQIIQLQFNTEIVTEKTSSQPLPLKNSLPNSKVILMARPTLNLELVIEASTKVDALLQRDIIINLLRKSLTWQLLSGYSDAKSENELENEVELISSRTQDPLPNKKAQVNFALRLPLKGHHLE